MKFFWRDGEWPKEQSIRFWWRSESPSPILPQFFTHVMHFSRIRQLAALGGSNCSTKYSLVSSLSYPYQEKCIFVHFEVKK